MRVAWRRANAARPALGAAFPSPWYPLPLPFLDDRPRAQQQTRQTQRRGLASFRSKAAIAKENSTVEEQHVAVLPASLESLGFKYLEVDKLRERFASYDTNGSGHIDLQEARQLLVDAGHSETDEHAARAVVDSMDVKGDGRVEWDEFKSAVDRAAEPVSSRVWPISGSLLLNFTGQGVMMVRGEKTMEKGPKEMIVCVCAAIAALRSVRLACSLVYREARHERWGVVR